MRVGLVGCVKRKGSVAAPAGELYVSPLFVGRRRFVEETCDRWFILSALHGLVDPAEVITPYDRTLVDRPVGERQAWAESVLVAIDKALGDVAGTVFEIHAGAAYRDFGLVEGLRRRGAEVVVPAAGLSQGQQLAFYAAPPGSSMQPPPTATSTSKIPPGRDAGGAALGEWLHTQDHSPVIVPFADIERMLDRSLPPSARRHRPWWGNSGGSSQARAWLGAGWRVAAVDMAGERVTFEGTAP